MTPPGQSWNRPQPRPATCPEPKSAVVAASLNRHREPKSTVIASRKVRHCEERSDEAIHPHQHDLITPIPGPKAKNLFLRNAHSQR